MDIDRQVERIRADGAVLAAAAGGRSYPRVDDADDVSCHPDFQLLIYPGYLVKDGGG